MLWQVFFRRMKILSMERRVTVSPRSLPFRLSLKFTISRVAVQLPLLKWGEWLCSSLNRCPTFSRHQMNTGSIVHAYGNEWREITRIGTGYAIMGTGEVDAERRLGESQWIQGVRAERGTTFSALNVSSSSRNRGALWDHLESKDAHLMARFLFPRLTASRSCFRKLTPSRVIIAR